MSSSGSGLSSYTRVAMLKHLIDGRSVDFAAAAAGVKRDRALEVVTQHGYPDKVAMLRRIAAMERLDAAASATSNRSAPPPASTRATPASAVSPQAGAVPAAAAPPSVAPAGAPKPAPQPPVLSPTPPSTQPSVPDLLKAAAASPLARTRALGTRVAGLVDDLVELVERDRAAAEAAERAAAERDRVAREIAVLQSRISQLQASVAPAKKSRGATTVKSGSVPAAAVSLVCDVAGCGRVFQGLQGLRMHRRRAHEGWGGHNAPARPPRSDTTLVEQQ